MKTATVYRSTEVVPYPNAATRRQILNKILDYVLVGACGMGLAAMLLLLLTII